jgi:hypothetical protein
MDVGAAGALIVFFAVLIATALLAILVLAYSGYSFLVTFINTTAGSDEIRWPGDPLVDWVFKGWYLAWLAVVWAAPALLVTSLFTPPPWVYVLVVGAVVWLLFPITLLSSLSAGSLLVILRPIIIKLWLRHLGMAMAFYFVSGILLAICGGLFYYGVVNRFVVLPVAAILGAFSMLVYARLLGRVGWIITWEDPATKRKKEKRPALAEGSQTFDPWAGPWAKPKPAVETPRPNPKSPPRPAKKKKSRTKPQGYDPWAPPPREPPTRKAKPAHPETVHHPAEEAYELKAEEPSRPLPTFSTPAEPAETASYRVKPLGTEPPPPVPQPALPAVSQLELELAASRRHAPPPPRPLWTGVYSFPFYTTSLGALSTLALGFLGAAGLLHVLLIVWPWR